MSKHIPIRQATEDAGAAVERHTPGAPAARLTVRTCYVCERTAAHGASWSFAGEPGRDDLCNDCTAARVHIVRMTVDHVSPSESYSIATCQCGWSNRVRRRGQDYYKRQDAIVRGHWVSVIKAATKVPA